MANWQTGDSVTLSAGGSIPLADYANVKPHASITRVMGDDPEADLAEMMQLLTDGLKRSMLVQMGFASCVAELLGDDCDVQAVVDDLMKGLPDGLIRFSADAAGEEGQEEDGKESATPRRPPKAKKGPRRK